VLDDEKQNIAPLPTLQSEGTSSPAGYSFPLFENQKVRSQPAVLAFFGTELILGLDLHHLHQNQAQ
jgi:hypothetical protein